jgi:Rieske Fe-S protein
LKTNAVSRRHALGGAATIGVALPVLVACGDGGGSTATEPSASPSSSAPQSEPPTSAPASKGPRPAAGIAATSEIPVGGGLILSDSEVVITQPEAGDFKAFTAICTHQGCTVTEVADTIKCPCHFSEFSIDDGSNVVGPNDTAAGSVAPLAAVEIVVDGDQISLG